MKIKRRKAERINQRPLNETQIDNQCLACSISLARMIAKGLNEDTPLQANDTEKRKAIANILHQQIRTVNRLVRALDLKTPIRLRIYHPASVDSLLYQTEILTNIVSDYVFPLLERTNNSKMRLP